MIVRFNPSMPRVREEVALPVLFASIGAIGGALAGSVLKKSTVGGAVIGAAIGVGLVGAAALEHKYGHRGRP